MKKLFLIWLLLFSLSTTVYAHSGGTDSQGGHSDGGDYHYHHGYPAHDHYDIDGDGDIDCPYNYVDNSKTNNNKTTPKHPPLNNATNNSTDQTSSENKSNTSQTGPIIAQPASTSSKKTSIGEQILEIVLITMTCFWVLGMIVAIFSKKVGEIFVYIGCLLFMLSMFIYPLTLLIDKFFS